MNGISSAWDAPNMPSNARESHENRYIQVSAPQACLASARRTAGMRNTLSVPMAQATQPGGASPRRRR